MGLRAWAATSGVRRRWLVLTALLLTFGGVALVIDRPKGAAEIWLAIPLLAAGAALLTAVFWPVPESAPVSSPSLGSRLIRRIGMGGRERVLFPAAGVLLVVLDLSYNFLLAATPGFGTEDVIALLTAAALLAYGMVPSRFARERDFVLLFFLALSAILVVPLLVLRLYLQNLDASVDAYSWVALAPETTALLSLLGVPVQLHSVAGATAPAITFTTAQSPTEVTVIITTACSGIYSAGIFAAAFLAYVLTEYDRPSRRLWVLLGLGLLAAYSANVLRMVVIVLVGYSTDTAQTDLQNMLVAHSYLGWIIFITWTALFWALLFRLLPVEKSAPPDAEQAAPASRQATRCRLCDAELMPAIPAVRCRCGACLHRACLAGASGCPACGRPASAVLAPVAEGAWGIGR